MNDLMGWFYGELSARNTSPRRSKDYTSRSNALRFGKLLVDAPGSLPLAIAQLIPQPRPTAGHQEKGQAKAAEEPDQIRHPIHTGSE